MPVDQIRSDLLPVEPVWSRRSHVISPKCECPPIKIAVLPSCVRSLLYHACFLLTNSNDDAYLRRSLLSETHFVIYFDRSAVAWSAPLRASQVSGSGVSGQTIPSHQTEILSRTNCPCNTSTTCSSSISFSPSPSSPSLTPFPSHP